MPGRRIARLCASFLTAFYALSCASIADAGEPDDAGDTEASSRALPASAYPQRWCIKTFLDERRKDQPLAVTRLTAPGTAAYSWADRVESDLAAEDAPDSASLASRLRNFHADSLMTLWRGRSRSVVLGVQKGGYLGVRMEEEPEEN